VLVDGIALQQTQEKTVVTAVFTGSGHIRRDFHEALNIASV
jgi:TPP-dependent pyruvate/acetoin dehydrogenase alpha subunit